MKTLLFAANGLVKPEYLQTQFEHTRNGDKLIICNGSMIKGFKDSCDKIIMDCENKYIEAWAVSDGITIEKYKAEVIPTANPVADAAPVTNVTNIEVTGIDSEDIDSLVQSQIAKAEVVAESEDTEKPHEVPQLSDIPVGWYKDPDGKEYERKKGPKLKGDLKAAIEKHGFENLTLKD